jgi:hypothetical protein
VPAQALMLLNNEFVLEQAGKWAERVTSTVAEPDRLGAMYLEAFARRPEAWEAREAQEYLAAGGTWAGLAHVLINSPEFIYVR